jgi:ABC-2 type transport system permease protein
MRDTITVFQKECAELLGDWHALYGTLVQTAIVIALCGVIVPATKAALWQQAGQVMLLFAVFPAIIAATIGADTFAGERERKTLETLLATPLSTHAIFLGKIGIAVGLACTTSVVTLGSGILTTNIAQATSAVFLPEAHIVLTVLVGALGFSLLTAALAMNISLHVPVARTAQQMTSMLSVVIVGALGFALKHLHLPLVWPTLLKVDIALVLAGGLALWAGLLSCRHDRLFASERHGLGSLFRPWPARAPAQTAASHRLSLNEERAS